MSERAARSTTPTPRARRGGEAAAAARWDALAKDFAARHGCHAVLLYGSHASGAAGKASDCDVLGLRARGPALRDVRRWRGLEIDGFVETASKLDPARDPELLRLRGGRVLLDRRGLGARLLRRVDAVWRKGRPRTPPDQVVAARAWAMRMLRRAGEGGGNSPSARTAFLGLLCALPDVYFELRSRWALGREKSLVWLREHDAPCHRALVAALRPRASLADLRALARRVLAVGR